MDPQPAPRSSDCREQSEGPQILSNLRATSDAGPISRILYGVSAVTVIPLGRPSLASSSDLPGSWARRAGTHEVLPPIPSLFGLAPCGVCPAPCIAARAVRSYRTFSPLPQACGPRRYVFCGTFRRTGSKAPQHAKRAPGTPLNLSSRTLSGTLLCGVRTFLPLAARPGATQRSRLDGDHPVQHQLLIL
jgi:hypothetical protein